MSTVPPHASGDQDRLRATYLNDHLAGAAGGLALARRLEKTHRDTEMHHELQRLVADIDADRKTLLELMGSLGSPRTRYKVIAAVAAERVGRFKLNGQMRGRSRLSTLIELEGLRLGVEGKAAAWRSLRELAQDEPRLNPGQLDSLLQRAGEQIDTLERLRVKAAREAFVGGR